MSFASAVTLEQAISGKTLPSYVKGVLYDSEAWSFTPTVEQRNPALYYRQAAAAAHGAGLIFIAAPALNLVARSTSASVTRNQAFLAQGLPQAVAAGADVYAIQSQSLERQASSYRSFVQAASAQAWAANPHVSVIAGLSSNPPGAAVTAAQLTAAASSVNASISGFWMNIPGNGPQCPTCNPANPQVAIDALAQLAAG
jgi:hypothetical protein